VLVTLGSLACGGGRAPQGPAPQSPQQAVERFMAAIKAKDLDRLGELWGRENGPASGHMKAEDLRKRVTVFQIYLNHVGYRVLGGPTPVPGTVSRQRFRLELERATSCVVAFDMDVVHVNNGAWLVANVDLATLSNPAARCAPSGTGTPR
jgi:hypothetical protein